MTENLKDLNLWMYLQKRYGVEVKFSESGYFFRRGATVFEDGNVELGLIKSRRKIRNDPKMMNHYIHRLCEVVTGNMMDFIKDDRILREKLAAMKIQARRRARG